MAQISIISRDGFPNWLRTDTSWFNYMGNLDSIYRDHLGISY